MSPAKSSLPAEGPNAMDIGRLFQTIKEDYVSDVRIEIRPFDIGNGTTGLMLELVSPGFQDDRGGQVVYVWAAKTFTNPFHLISTGQLFDLLITGYRTMERYFEHGSAFAPATRVV